MFYSFSRQFNCATAVAVGALLLGEAGLSACGHHVRTTGTAAAAEESSGALKSLEGVLQALDADLAPAYGTALPDVARAADAQWPFPVSKMVATERTLQDFSKAEALAVHCEFSDSYKLALQAAAKTLADEDLVAPGYRSVSEIARTRAAELEAEKKALKNASAADCQVQESRVRATATLAKSLSGPRTEQLAEVAVPATFHRDLLRIAKIEEIAERCAVPDDMNFLLSELAKGTEKLATQAGAPMEEFPAWRDEGAALGQFAFGAWPSVNCDLLRRALQSHLKSLEAAQKALEAATAD